MKKIAQASEHTFNEQWSRSKNVAGRTNKHLDNVFVLLVEVL